MEEQKKSTIDILNFTPQLPPTYKPRIDVLKQEGEILNQQTQKLTQKFKKQENAKCKKTLF